MSGGFQSIAAVVASAAGNPNGVCMRRYSHGQLCGGQASALHQCVGGKFGLGLKF
jgi:hypothetical protein